MSFGITVTLPFLAAILYGLAMLLLKRASGFSVGLTRTLFIANWIAAGFALLLLPLQQEAVQWNYLHLPLVGGLFFFLGQALTFIAIRLGDVSVVTPAMGLKVVFVAWLSVSLFGMPLGAPLIAGAFLAMVGVVLDWPVRLDPPRAPLDRPRGCHSQRVFLFGFRYSGFPMGPSLRRSSLCGGSPMGGSHLFPFAHPFLQRPPPGHRGQGMALGRFWSGSSRHTGRAFQRRPGHRRSHPRQHPVQFPLCLGSPVCTLARSPPRQLGR